jgi:kynurenine formamidase
LKDLAAQVSNWGRWGADDRRGTINLIDAAAVQRGITAAKQGKVISLSMAFDEDGPQMGMIPGRDNPSRTMLMIDQPMNGDPTDFCTTDDRVEMGVQASTHWDALSHASYENLLYNGVSTSTIDETGSLEHGIERYGPIVSRGILLDVARALGVDRLEENHPISGDDLDAAAALAGVTVESGDIICVRTGQMQYFYEGEKMRYIYPSPGMSTLSIPWVRDHDVAAVATDTLVFECFPPEDPAVWLPVHMLHIRDMGLCQGQNWDLEALAIDCAADGQYQFLLNATPLPMTRSAGGAVAPVAIK